MQVKKYFEKKVSLLSTSDVRYDGELYTVDPSEQSIALKHVNCMGTEGRRTGDQAIAPSDCTYEFIIFRAVNIRELWLDEGNGNRRDLTDEILIPLRQGQTNNNYQKRDMYEQDQPKRKVGYQSHSSQQQQGYDPYYQGGHAGGYDTYYSRGGGGYGHGHQQAPPPPQPYYDSYGHQHQQAPPPPQTYYDTPSQNNYYRGQQPYPQRQPRAQYGPPPVNVYQNQQRRQRPPQYYNQQQQRPPQYYNQSYHRGYSQPRPQYGYSQQPRRYGAYNQQNRRYNNQQGGRNYSQQRNTRRQGGQSGGKTAENQAGTGAFLDTRRLRGTEIDIKNEQDFDFGAAKNEFDQKDSNEQMLQQVPIDTQQNGVNIFEDKPVPETDNIEDNNDNNPQVAEQEQQHKKPVNTCIAIFGFIFGITFLIIVSIMFLKFVWSFCSSVNLILFFISCLISFIIVYFILMFVLYQQKPKKSYKNISITKWEWQNNKFEWKPYSDDINKKINALSDSFSTCEIKIGNYKYLLKKLSNNAGTQKNFTTKKLRHIRKISTDMKVNAIDAVKVWDAAEYSNIKQMFFRTVSRLNYEIVNIQNVCNKYKDKVYEANVLSKCEEYNKQRDKIETLLWHGTTFTNIENILKSGFDRNYNKVSAYGIGTYFAANSSYSIGYSKKYTNGYQYILLCKVIIGVSTVGKRSQKQIVKKYDGTEYDSMVDNMCNPLIFVIPRDYHAIPKYLITFRKK